MKINKRKDFEKRKLLVLYKKRNAPYIFFKESYQNMCRLEIRRKINKNMLPKKERVISFIWVRYYTIQFDTFAIETKTMDGKCISLSKRDLDHSFLSYW